MIYRILDVEAVVDESVWTRPDPTYKWLPTTRTEVEARHRDDLPGQPLVEERKHQEVAVAVAVEPFPPPQAWRVVTLSCVDVSFDPADPVPYAFRGARSECLWAPGRPADEQDARERELLSMFADSMARHEGQPAGAGVHLVTWNGRGYDLPVIVMRCLKHGISCGWYYKPRDMRYRYSAEGHLDLMDFLGDYGAGRQMKLSDVARLVGLPGKMETKGTDVADLYAEAARCSEKAGEAGDRLARYCLQDTTQTALVFLRSLVLRGMLAPAACDAAVGTFAASEAVRGALGWAEDDPRWDRVRLGARS